MEKIQIKTVVKDCGKRLDLYLAEFFLGKYSRTYLQKLISDGNVLINDKPCKSNYRIAPEDNIDVLIPEPKNLEAEAQDMPLDIVYEDKDMLVVNKPAGMVTHPGAGIKSSTLVNALLHHCKDLSGIGGVLRPGIVHRLDKDTSGLMLVAKNDFTHRALARQFKERKVERKYLALVEGVMEFDNDRINLPIGKDKRNREKMSVEYGGSRDAVSIYKVIKRFKDSTLVEIMPITGRTHQIRVHMKAIGHTIAGDVKYGAKTNPIGRQALHAKWIKFFHPGLKKNMEFSSEAPF